MFNQITRDGYEYSIKYVTSRGTCTSKNPVIDEPSSDHLVYKLFHRLKVSLKIRHIDRDASHGPLLLKYVSIIMIFDTRWPGGEPRPEPGKACWEGHISPYIKYHYTVT